MLFESSLLLTATLENMWVEQGRCALAAVSAVGLLGDIFYLMSCIPAFFSPPQTHSQTTKSPYYLSSGYHYTQINFKLVENGASGQR